MQGLKTNLPILMYHALSKSKVDNRYTIEEREFLNQIEYMYENHFQTILAEEYLLSLRDRRVKIPHKSVMITFDDGSESDLTIALPILKRFNFKANYFVTTDWIGKPGYMNPSHIRTLKKEGMSVQSHSKTHQFLDVLKTSEIYFELAESKKKLEDILGADVSCLSFPGGRYNKEVITCGKQLKFAALFSSVPFSLKRFNDMFLVGRYSIKQSMGRGIYFEDIMNSNILKRSALKGAYYGKFFLKKIMGNYLYYRAWRKYIGKS